MEEIAISKFKATCLRLIDEVKKTGKTIIVTRKGEPVAQVSPPPPPAKTESWMGSLKDTVEIKGDILSPASNEEDWEMLRN